MQTSAGRGGVFPNTCAEQRARAGSLLGKSPSPTAPGFQTCSSSSHSHLGLHSSDCRVSAPSPDYRSQGSLGESCAPRRKEHKTACLLICPPPSAPMGHVEKGFRNV